MTAVTTASPLPVPPDPFLRRVAHVASRVADLVVPGRVPTAQQVLQIAQRANKTDDWGAQDIRVPLEVLIDSINSGPALSSLGRRLVRGNLIDTATHHLQIVQVIRQLGDVESQPVTRPLFIVGLPRTGTTLLYNLLCCDPHRRPMQVWEAMNPCNPEWSGHKDRRKSRTRMAVRALHWFVPDMSPIHHINPDGPEECFSLLHRTFVSGTFSSMFPANSYLEWLLKCDDEVLFPAYQFYKSQLQLLQRDQPPRPWVLKNPAHICGLRGLLHTFPDACIIQTHRDLTKVAPSWLSLTRVMRALTLADPGTNDHLRTMEIYADVIHSAIAARASSPHQFCDVHFRDVVKDPLATIRQIYQHFGLTLTPEHESAAAQWIKDNPQHKHGKHSYSLAEFGLSPEYIRERFAFYADHFRVAEE